MNSDANAEFGLALHIKGYVWLGEALATSGLDLLRIAKALSGASWPVGVRWSKGAVKLGAALAKWREAPQRHVRVRFAMVLFGRADPSKVRQRHRRVFLRTDALWCCSADSCVAKAVLGKAGALR
jgi:hypothetical protein